MITLIIKNNDGSVYWTECFSDLITCNSWLREEITRPYWDISRTHEIIDDSPTNNELLQQKWNKFREKRNYFLSSCDFVLFLDYSISPSKLEDIKQYRQLLRDLPELNKNIENPDLIIFPVMPPVK